MLGKLYLNWHTACLQITSNRLLWLAQIEMKTLDNYEEKSSSIPCL